MAFQMCPVFRVGVEVLKIFRLRKVFVRSVASEMGSDSFFDAPGYLSTSSRKRFRMGRLASCDGLLEPTITRYIPSN